MAVEWARELKPTAFYGTPSYALQFAETARREGIDPRTFGLRTVFFSGEPGAGIPATKRLIEETFGGRCVDMGSMAEMTPWMTNAECRHRTGMHLWQDLVYTQVCAPETFAPLPFGAEGTPVYTHLERTSQPMIRLVSGDLARWTDEPCPCGRTYPRLPDGLYGRIDDMFIVRGEHIYPSAIEDTLRALVGRVGRRPRGHARRAPLRRYGACARGRYHRRAGERQEHAGPRPRARRARPRADGGDPRGGPVVAVLGRRDPRRPHPDERSYPRPRRVHPLHGDPRRARRPLPRRRGRHRRPGRQRPRPDPRRDGRGRAGRGGRAADRPGPRRRAPAPTGGARGTRGRDDDAARPSDAPRAGAPRLRARAADPHGREDTRCLTRTRSSGCARCNATGRRTSSASSWSASPRAARSTGPARCCPSSGSTRPSTSPTRPSRRSACRAGIPSRAGRTRPCTGDGSGRCGRSRATGREAIPTGAFTT